MRKLACIAAGIALLAGACAKRDTADLFAPEAGTVVVDGFLAVGEPMPPIVLSQTLAANVPWSRDAAAIAGAIVVVATDSGNAVYGDLPGHPGTYVPFHTTLPYLVQPGTTYRLEARVPDGRRVRATTRTPQRFRVNDWLLLDDAGQTELRRLATFEEYGDSVFARPENQLEYALGLLEARFDVAGVRGIQVGLSSRSPGSPLLIDPDLVGEENLDRNNSSPPISPQDGALRLPWLAIFFEGKYVLKIWTMDDNWFDLARTDPVLAGGGFGFGGQAGDDFERPLFRIEGGIGLFGSGAVDSLGIVVHPRP